MLGIMKKPSYGYTLVEVVMVIVVIGILTTVGIFVWGGVTQSSRDRVRETDLQTWISSFDNYRARFVVNPVLPTADGVLGAKAVCLGSFSSYNGKCGQYASSAPNAQLSASASSSLLSELTKIGKTPTNNSPDIKGSLIGPILYSTQSTAGGTITVTSRFINFFEGSCPSKMSGEYTTTTLPQPIALVLTGLPTGTSAHACYIEKTFSYTPN